MLLLQVALETAISQVALDMRGRINSAARGRSLEQIYHSFRQPQCALINISAPGCAAGEAETGQHIFPVMGRSNRESKDGSQGLTPITPRIKLIERSQQ
jgi:hypothetical protein